jgi:WD40 repeat protein
MAAAAFTADGKSLVSINSRRGEVIWWDLATGKSKTIGAHLPENSSKQYGERYVLAVSPDGKTIASAPEEEYEITLWDVAGRAKKGTLKAEQVSPLQLVWSHDGKFLVAARAVGDKRGVAIYDLASGKARVFQKQGSELLRTIALSPDDTLLAVDYDGNGVGLWDVAAGTEWQWLDGAKTSSGHALAFSPDGALLATVGETLRPESVRLWDVSKHPGSSASGVKLSAATGVTEIQDDALAASIEQSIRGGFPPKDISALTVTLHGDGTVELTGKISDGDAKRRAGEIAENYVGQDRWLPVRKVVNKLEAAREHRQ